MLDRLARIAGVGLCLLLAGCGGAKPVSVTGAVVLPPKVSLKDDDSLQLSFTPDGSGKSAGASANPKDGSFTAELVPGKYKIGVAIKPYAGHKESAKREESFRDLNKAFHVAATKLSYEVTSDPKQSIKVDLAAGNVVKK